MQIIIDIPEFKIPKQQDIIEIPLHFVDGKVCEAGGYGFDVLPKGHGRLVDIGKYEKKQKYADPWKLTRTVGQVVRDWESIELSELPTIIEADTESEEEV